MRWAPIRRAGPFYSLLCWLWDDLFLLVVEHNYVRRADIVGGLVEEVEWPNLSIR
jgi:hypothetical protein